MSIPKQFVLYKDSRNEWRWRLYAANGLKIADSAEGYINRADAIRGIKLVAETSSDAPIWEPGTATWVT